MCACAPRQAAAGEALAVACGWVGGCVACSAALAEGVGMSRLEANSARLRLWLCNKKTPFH